MTKVIYAHQIYPDYNKNYSIYLLKRGKFDVFHPAIEEK